MTVGPLAAGALIGPLGWQAIFWLNVPIAAMLLILSAFTIPASRNESAPRLDVLGALLATAVFAPLTYGIIEGPTYGWLSAHVLGAFAIATIALALFVAWERHVAAPMLDLAWFSHRRLRLGAGLLALGFTAMIGIVYISVLFLQQHQLHGALRTGTELLPLGAGILAGAAINGPVVGRFGIRLPVLTGLLMLAAGSAVLAIAHSGYLPVAISLGVIGLGAGLWLPNLADAVLNGTPLQASGVAGATGDAAVELGSALGIALLGSVLTSSYHSRLPATISQLPAAAHSAVQRQPARRARSRHEAAGPPSTPACKRGWQRLRSRTHARCNRGRWRRARGRAARDPDAEPRHRGRRRDGPHRCACGHRPAGGRVGR